MICGSTAHVHLKNVTCEKSRAAGVQDSLRSLNQGFPLVCAPSASRTAKLPRCLQRKRPASAAAPPARGAGRRGARPRASSACSAPASTAGSSPTRSTSPAPRPRRPTTMLREHFGDSAPFAILLRGPAGGDRPPGPGAGPRAARATRAVTTLSPWDRGSVAAPAAQPAPGADPRRLPRRHSTTRSTTPSPSSNEILDEQIHAAGARDPDRLRDPLAGDPGRVDRRRRARRADRPADPADRPPARLPLAGRGGDPARLRRGHRGRLARPALHPHRLVRHRRLRAHRLHDDGPGARGRLRAADGLALPRGAGGGRRRRSRRRAATRRTAGRTTAFAGSTLLLSMLVAFFIVPGSLLASLAATVALVVVLSVARRDRRRPGAARPARPQRRPLADRRGARRRALAA